MRNSTLDTLTVLDILAQAEPDEQFELRSQPLPVEAAGRTAGVLRPGRRPRGGGSLGGRVARTERGVAHRS